MSTDLIFYTQIASLVAFVAALFWLYRVLVAQKDGTIELLREKNRFLSDQLEQLKAQSPDVLLESVSKRYKEALEEIKRRDVDDARKKELAQQAFARAQREGKEQLEKILAQVTASLREGDSSS